MIVVLFVVVVSRYRCQFDRSVWVYPFYEQEGLADPLYPLDNTLCSYKHHTTSKYRCTNLTVYLFFIFFFCLRGSMSEASRTVKVHCVYQRAVVGLCTAKRSV